MEMTFKGAKARKLETEKGAEYIFTDPCYLITKVQGVDYWDSFLAAFFGVPNHYEEGATITLPNGGLMLVGPTAHGDGIYDFHSDGDRVSVTAPCADVDAGLLCCVKVSDLTACGFLISGDAEDQPRFISTGQGVGFLGKEGFSGQAYSWYGEIEVYTDSSSDDLDHDVYYG